MMPTVTGTAQCLVPAYHLHKAAFRPSKGPSQQCSRDAALGLGQARLDNSSSPQLSRREIAARQHALPSDFLSSPTLDKGMHTQGPEASNKELLNADARSVHQWYHSQILRLSCQY